MALGTLTLSTTSGVQGRRFAAKISGLTTGKVEIGGDGAPGFSVVNGMLYSSGLPYPTSTVVLREYDPGAAVSVKETRIDIAAVTAYALMQQAQAALGQGRTLLSYSVASTAQPDGSTSYSLYVRDDLGATTVSTISAVPANALLGEDGNPILTEDGQYILAEDPPPNGSNGANQPQS